MALKKLSEKITEVENVRYFNELFEETKPSASSNTKGVLHEVLVGYHLKGKKHMEHHEGKTGESPKELHDRLKSTISHEEYKKIHDRAKASADHIKEHLKSMGHSVHDVHWTSKPGDLHKSTGIEASQKEDASDIVVHVKDKKGKKSFHGISLKVSDKKNKHLPVSNPGSESMYGAHHLIKAHRESMEKQHPKLKNSNAKGRKEYVRSLSAKENAKVREQNVKTLHKVCDHVHDHLKNAGTHAIAEHIRTHVLQSHQTPMQKNGHHHWRMTTYAGKSDKEHAHHIIDPHSHYEHILKDHKNITIHKNGTSIIFKHKGKQFAKHRMKFESGSDTHSSLKGSGEPNA